MEALDFFTLPKEMYSLTVTNVVLCHFYYVLV